jgi:hypothetical protein
LSNNISASVASTTSNTNAILANTASITANANAIASENLRATTAEGLKENVSNKSLNISADATSDTKYPSVKAVKDFVDSQNAAGGVSDGAITSTKIANATILNIDVAPNAAIDFSKLNIQKSDVLGLGIGKFDLGLGNVDNTSDALKPISTATQTALTTETARATAAELALTTSVNANTASITTLSASVASSVASVTSNTTAILANTASITANTTSIAGLTSQVTSNTNAVSTETARATAAELALTTSVNANTASITAELLLKENLSNKSIDLIADASSTVKYPSVKLVKDYVDKNITTSEVALSTKIGGKQLYAITGTFIAGGTSALITVTKPADMSDYYSITTFKDGKTFRKQIISFDLTATTNNVVTGSGFLTEVYPAATYTYVLEYFK